MSVHVKDTDYDAPDEYVVGTTVNGGVPVHGKCSPSDGAAVDARGFFECAKYVPLPPSADSTYTFVTTATEAVDERPWLGSFVHVEYMVDCEGTCAPPSAPPSPPPPSPIPPTCSYSATPAGGGDGGGGDGGADGGAHWPSQSTMYSTCTKLPSYGSSSTAGVAVVTNVYVPSALGGSATYLAHSKKPRASTTAPSDGLHRPCTGCPPFTVVPTTYSSSAS